jgi:hypothetical protein
LDARIGFDEFEFASVSFIDFPSYQKKKVKDLKLSSGVNSLMGI